MALRTVLTWPDSRLRDIATDLSVVDQSVLSLVEDLFDTMYVCARKGIDEFSKIFVSNPAKATRRPELKQLRRSSGGRIGSVKAFDAAKSR